MVKNLEFLSQKLKVFHKNFKTLSFIVIRSNLLDNLTFYLPEIMPKPTETSKKVNFLEKFAKISKFSEEIAKISKFFGTNCKFLERTAKISRFLEQIAIFWKELQKSQGFWNKLQIFGKNYKNLKVLASFLLLLV